MPVRQLSWGLIHSWTVQHDMVAFARGNAMRLVSVNEHWVDGATATEEALKCKAV